MRLTKTLILCLAAALTACATPAPPPAAPDPAPIAVGPPEPPPPPRCRHTPAGARLQRCGWRRSGTVARLRPDLWERIVDGYAIPDIDGPLVEKWERWYADRPDYVARMVERSRRYLYHIVGEVTERGMPTEIALLPMVESAFNPVAMSTSRASGIWQFIPSTGKHYGLNQDFWMDSRRDVLAGTEKALTYLLKLHGDFDDWQLALAGYNWGEGNVAKAVARNKAKGLPTTYQSLAMPAETANYLPKLQAIKNIVRDPEKFGLALADIPDAPYFAVVKTNRKMDTKFAADLAEMSLEDFLALNPQHNRPVIAGADEQTLLLPIDNAEIFAAKLELTNQPMVSWQAYRMRPNETLAAGRGQIRDVAGDAARGQRHRRQSEGAGRPYAARAFAKRVDRSGRVAVAGGLHDGPLGPHVLLHGEERRQLGGHRRPLWRHAAGIESVERLTKRHAGAGPEAASHQRCRARAERGRTHQARGGDQGRRQAGAGGREATRRPSRSRPRTSPWRPSSASSTARPRPTPAARRRRAARRKAETGGAGAGRSAVATMKNGRRQMASPVLHPSRLATDLLTKELTASWRPSSWSPSSWLPSSSGRPSSSSLFLAAFFFGAAFFFFVVFLAAFFFGAAFFFVVFLAAFFFVVFLAAFFFVVFLAAFFFGAAFFFVAFLAAFFFGAAFFFVALRLAALRLGAEAAGAAGVIIDIMSAIIYVSPV